MLFFRYEDRGNKSSLKAWNLVDRCDIHGFFDHTLNNLETQFAVSVFTSAEHQGNFNAVAMFDELAEVAHFGVVVVISHVDPEFNFFELGLHLVLLLLFLFLFLVVLEFAVVHDFTHGWLAVRSDLDQIKTVILRSLEGDPGFYNSELIAVIVNDANFRDTNAMIDSDLRLALLSASVIWLNLRPPDLLLSFPTLPF